MAWCPEDVLSAQPGPAHTPGSAHRCTHVCCPLRPLPGRCSGTLRSGNFFLCYFLMELEVALKPAWFFRGREVKAVQGM